MSYSGGYKREDDDEFNDDAGEEEDDQGGRFRSNNDHVILLVDARKNMFEEMDESGETYFQAAMKMCAQVMKTKVVTSDKHRVGVTFLGTRKTSDLEETNLNVFVALELAAPSAKRIRDVEALSKGEVDFDRKYGSVGEDQPCPLRSGLWSSHTEFMTVKHPGDFKRVFILTNDDDPLKGDEDEKKKVHIVAKDAIESSIEIQLFHIKRKGKPFNVDKCYRAILSGDGDDFNEQSIGDGAESAHELMDRVRRKEFKKRRLARLTFHLCEGLELEGGATAPKVSFDVQLFNMVHTATRPSPIHLDARRNKPVQIISKLMDDKTGAQLDEHEVRTYLEFGGERAYVSKDEMAGLKAVSPNGLTLLGFRAMETLRPDFNVRSPYFLYPDEDSTHGSAKAFIALHSAMLSKNVYGLARFTRARGAAPRMVALLAQEEELEDGMQVCPPGMHAVVLPFSDEVREARVAGDGGVRPKAEEDEKGVAAAECLVKALKLDSLDCRNFENPVLQRHYAALQAIALAEEDIAWDTAKDDTTRPDDEAVDAAVAPLLDAFKASYGGDQEDDVPAAGAKRSAGGGGDSCSSKRVKTEESADKIDWQEALKKGEIDRFTMPTLKGFLKSNGLSVSGKKADIVNRVKQNLGGD